LQYQAGIVPTFSEQLAMKPFIAGTFRFALRALILGLLWVSVAWAGDALFTVSPLANSSEPTLLLLFGSGLVVVGMFGKKRKA